MKKLLIGLSAICAVFFLSGSYQPDKTNTTQVSSIGNDLYEQLVSEITIQTELINATNEKRTVKIEKQRGFVKLEIPKVYSYDAIKAYEEDNSLIIPSDNITCGFGYDEWRHGMHRGIDIVRPKGDPIYAAASGTIAKVVTGCPHNYGKEISCGCGNGYGDYIIIDHGDGLQTLYGHCQTIYVKQGQSVKRNEKIAEVGSTGWSTGWHLHFEVRDNGQAMNPFDYA